MIFKDFEEAVQSAVEQLDRRVGTLPSVAWNEWERWYHAYDQHIEALLIKLTECCAAEDRPNLKTTCHALLALGYLGGLRQLPYLAALNTVDDEAARIEELNRSADSFAPRLLQAMRVGGRAAWLDKQYLLIDIFCSCAMALIRNDLHQEAWQYYRLLVTYAWSEGYWARATVLTV